MVNISRDLQANHNSPIDSVNVKQGEVTTGVSGRCLELLDLL